MAFKILYHEDALAELEGIFEWSREKDPETTQQFAKIFSSTSNCFKTSQLWRLLHSPLYVYYRLDGNRGAIEILHFWYSSRKEPQF